MPFWRLSQNYGFVDFVYRQYGQAIEYTADEYVSLISIHADFSGSLSQNDYSTNDIMDIGELCGYLAMYPSTSEFSTNYDGNGIPISSYGFEEANLSDKLQLNITSGIWPGFPYVQLGERIYFSKKAVDDWFYEQGKAQLSIKQQICPVHIMAVFLSMLHAKES